MVFGVRVQRTTAVLHDGVGELHMKHPLVNRTSAKGTPFIGTCAACGKTGITFAMLPSDECDNVRGMTQEQAILEAITQETQP
jgi:hypothetical protein